MSGLRFSPDAADVLRRAIRDAGGVEVFAIGDVIASAVVAVTITCRGTEDRVSALLDRPRAGQVVIHNHPSGVLRPSDADFQLAGFYGDDGVGFVIVDSKVERDAWIVEPHAPKAVAVDPAAVEAFFRDALPRVLPDVEPRPQQLDMALRAADAFSDGHPLVVEAGTGTGKSLAYLVPAAMWALANDGRVVVSTYTKALQGQLLHADLPLLPRAGLAARYAVLLGRNNYVCKRRLGLALEDADEGDDRAAVQAIADWERATADGARGDLPFPIEADVWERVESDTDLTLRLRCEHYTKCWFYEARRRAGAAHLLVVNHALLLADLAMKAEGARGLLPTFHRVVLDEAHHLEDAATGATSARLSGRAVERALFGLLGTRKRRGALHRLEELAGKTKGLDPEALGLLPARVAVAEAAASQLRQSARDAMVAVAGDVIGPEGHPARITPSSADEPAWRDGARPRLEALVTQIEEAVGVLDAALQPFDEATVDPTHAQALLDVRRARRRLGEHASTARAFVNAGTDACRWVEIAGPRARLGDGAIVSAPVDVGPRLRQILWGPFPGVVATSATIAVAGRFDWWLRRSGLLTGAPEPTEDGPVVALDAGPTVDSAVLPSPFDHARQAMLGLPNDLPEPDDPAWLRAVAHATADAVRTSDGGAFVLCTSYRLVDALAAALRADNPARTVLAQGEAGVPVLLDRFRDDRRAVLVGTDAFWEGVSVKGEGLRLIVIPRLPFRVPTEPLRLARLERIAANGGDPFRSQSLPEATIKLKQGYGRLIRHREDRGVVVILDRRVHARQYGAQMLRSLPPARRATGPWVRVLEQIAAFYGPGTAPPPPPIRSF